MSVLMLASVPGDPDDLVERYTRQQALLAEEFDGPPPGYLFHACATTDQGLAIANLVESEATVWDLRPRFERTARAVGLPDPEIAVHPVVNAVGVELAPMIAAGQGG